MDLVEVSTGRRVAGEHFDGALDQIFRMQDRIVRKVCDWLAVEAVARSDAPSGLSAYECYARGRREAVKYERDAFDRAREFYEKAIAADPRYAQALAGLAHTYAMRFTYTSDRSVLETACVYARRATEVDPTLAEPHIWRGYALWRLGHRSESEAAFARTRELDPSEFYGFYFASILADPDTALLLLQRAIDIDPVRGFAWWGLGAAHFLLCHYVEAASCFERCARLYSASNALPVPGIEGYWAECLRLVGQLEEARAKSLAGLDSVERTDFMYRDTTRIFCLGALGRIAEDQGDGDAACAAFEQAIQQVKGRPRTVAGGILLVRSLTGLARLTRDRAFYEEARSRMARRDEFDFSWVWMCDECYAHEDLARTAIALGEPAEPLVSESRIRTRSGFPAARRAGS
jgi:tetratricopeptide (TPR) repeat protein